MTAILILENFIENENFREFGEPKPKYILVLVTETEGFIISIHFPGK